MFNTRVITIDNQGIDFIDDRIKSIKGNQRQHLFPRDIVAQKHRNELFDRLDLELVVHETRFVMLIAGAGAVSERSGKIPHMDAMPIAQVAGIPGAFTSEYLRIVGAIVRICRNKRQLDRILSTKDPDRFVALLSSAEVKL